MQQITVLIPEDLHFQVTSACEIFLEEYRTIAKRASRARRLPSRLLPSPGNRSRLRLYAPQRWFLPLQRYPAAPQRPPKQPDGAPPFYRPAIPKVRASARQI